MMYAWKCWRDNRLVLIVFLVCQLVFLAVAWFVHGQDPPTQLTEHAWQARQAQDWMRVQAVMLYPLAVVTIGVPTTSFWLTRPVARWRMIWIGFAVALAEFAVAFTLTGVGAAVHVARVLPGAFVVPSSVMTDPTLSLLSIIALLVLGYILAASIARGVAVLIILFMPRRKAIYWVPMIVLVYAYFFVSTMQPDMVQHWSHWLPLLVPKIVSSRGSTVAVQPHLLMDFGIRGALLLLLPFAAQKALEAREV